MKLRLLICVAFFALTMNSFGQKNAGDENWTLITTNKNVSVYYEQASCNNNAVVFVRIVNNNPTAATIDWKLWEGGESKQLEVKANETITGGCENRPRVFLLTDRIPVGKTVNDLKPVVSVNVKR